jgi:hypothetical protein
LSAPEASSSPLRAIQRIHVPGVIEKLHVPNLNFGT